MGQICWPEAPLTNYPSTLRTVPKQGRSEPYKTLIFQLTFSHLINYLAPLSSSTVIFLPIRNRQCQYQTLTCDVLFGVYITFSLFSLLYSEQKGIV